MSTTTQPETAKTVARLVEALEQAGADVSDITFHDDGGYAIALAESGDVSTTGMGTIEKGNGGDGGD